MLLRQLPLKMLQPPEGWKLGPASVGDPGENTFVAHPGGVVTFGKVCKLCGAACAHAIFSLKTSPPTAGTTSTARRQRPARAVLPAAPLTSRSTPFRGQQICHLQPRVPGICRGWRLPEAVALD